MPLKHFVHSIRRPRDGDPAEPPRRQFVGVWDARTDAQSASDEWIPQLLSELESAASSHIDSMPWLRAIVLVPPQPSDALALSVMDRGVVMLEALREHAAVQVIEHFLQQAEQFQGAATSRTRTPGASGHINNESEFSRTPAYFNQDLYTEWQERLSRPWRQEDAFDTDV